jgi:membrane associated rhomboid family serine protease
MQDCSRLRGEPAVALTPWVMRLLIANVAVYLLTMAGPRLVEFLMFVPALTVSRPWTIITYMFVHGGTWHIFFNMLGLIFFGPRVEDELGERDFLLLYFLSGISGAVLSCITPFTAIVGASGALYGVMMAYAYLWPRAEIYIWGLLPVQARWLVVFMTAMSLYGGFSGTDQIAHFAHLGGFIGGFLFIRWRSLKGRRVTPAQTILPAIPAREDLHRWSKIDRSRLHEVNREEFDRIQMKIREMGAARLTQSEREFLDRFSQDDVN